MQGQSLRLKYREGDIKANYWFIKVVNKVRFLSWWPQNCPKMGPSSSRLRKEAFLSLLAKRRSRKMPGDRETATSKPDRAANLRRVVFEKQCCGSGAEPVRLLLTLKHRSAGRCICIQGPQARLP